jgi:ABC-type phosphate transport system substrate-binding protein
MRRPLVRALVSGAAGVSLLASATATASAATPATFPNSGYGFDGNANLIVGGGSTTLFRMMQSLAALWEDTASCVTNNSVYDATTANPQPYPQSAPAFNQCTPSAGQSYAGGSAGGDFDGDTVAVADAVGSSTGIGSLNGSHSGNSATYAYEGTNANLPTSGDPNAQNGESNGYGTVDFALSSRAAKISGGNCPTANPTSGKAGDELQCDTFWGVAADGVEVFTFDASSGAYDAGATNSGGSGGFSAQDLYDIYTCDVVASGGAGANTWGSLPEWQAVDSAYLSANSGATSDPNLPAANAPIVPYAMSSGSGTLSDLENFIDAGVPAANNNFNPDNYSCARELAGGVAPLENDVKPLITNAQSNAFTPPAYPSGTTSPYAANATYPAGVSTAATSPQNPINWLWFGSSGLLSQFPYLAGGTVDGATFSTAPVPIASSAETADGLTPTSADINAGTYPIGRVLSVVTPKSFADCPVTSGVCNFTATPGPTNGNGVADLNVTGATAGRGGAVREFIRFLCRKTASLEPTDPYTGANTLSEIGTDIAASGFTTLPVAEKSSGSSCDVQSVG